MPYCLSSSDDMTIRLWDWDKGWVRPPIASQAVSLSDTTPTTKYSAHKIHTWL